MSESDWVWVVSLWSLVIGVASFIVSLILYNIASKEFYKLWSLTAIIKRKLDDIDDDLR